MYGFDKTSNYVPQSTHQMNNVTIPPRDQYLRHTRYHIYLQDFHGVVGYYPQHDNNFSVDQNATERVIDSNNIVENTHKFLKHFNTHQLDIFAYKFPYHMNDSNMIKPSAIKLEKRNIE